MSRDFKFTGVDVHEFARVAKALKSPENDNPFRVSWNGKSVSVASSGFLAKKGRGNWLSRNKLVKLVEQCLTDGNIEKLTPDEQADCRDFVAKIVLGLQKEAETRKPTKANKLRELSLSADEVCSRLHSRIESGPPRTRRGAIVRRGEELEAIRQVFRRQVEPDSDAPPASGDPEDTAAGAHPLTEEALSAHNRDRGDSAASSWRDSVSSVDSDGSWYTAADSFYDGDSVLRDDVADPDDFGGDDSGADPAPVLSSAEEVGLPDQVVADTADGHAEPVAVAAAEVDVPERVLSSDPKEALGQLIDDHFEDVSGMKSIVTGLFAGCEIRSLEPRDNSRYEIHFDGKHVASANKFGMTVKLDIPSPLVIDLSKNKVGLGGSGGLPLKKKIRFIGTFDFSMNSLSWSAEGGPDGLLAINWADPAYADKPDQRTPADMIEYLQAELKLRFLPG